MDALLRRVWVCLDGSRAKLSLEKGKENAGRQAGDGDDEGCQMIIEVADGGGVSSRRLWRGRRAGYRW